MNAHRTGTRARGALVSLLSLASLGVAMLGSTGARALDIVTQDLVVDVSGETLHVEIDAVIDGGGELPIYAFAAPATATLDGAPLALVDDDGDYAGLVQWLTVPDDGGTVHIVIDGAPSCRSKTAAGMDSCTFTTNERVLLPAEPGSGWYLMSLLGADLFTGSVAVRAPTDHFVASGQGAARDVVTEGTSTLATFDVTVPTEMMLVVSRAVDVVTADRVTAGVPDEASRAPMQRIADTAARVLPRYEEMFGALAVDEVHFLPVSGRFPFGGMGLLGDVLIGDFIALPAFDYMVEQGAAHELAHSWWGGMTSAIDPNEGGFLQEAFAEYSAWRALGADDPLVRDAGVRMNAVWYLTQVGDDDVAILDATDPAAYVLVTYHKGSGVLRALEERVGVDAFTEALAGLVARGPLALSVDALQEELELASGIDVGADLDQWLRRPGHPRLAVAVRDGAVHVDDTEGFDVDVPLRLVRADGSVEERSVRTGDAVALDDTRGANGVVLVDVDPRWTLVRTVEPALRGDVSCDGRVDAVDLMEIALRSGGRIPDARRQDGSYDPLYDLDADGAIGDDDVDAAYALGSTP